MAATTWFVVGRSLRPVERMRREVEGITAARLATRIPSPGGDDEIARLASTLNEMLDRLDDSARAQRRFVSDASHELRSPLAVMRQLAEVTQAYPGRIETELLADTVLTEGQRLADLVQGMLILARADEGGLEPSMNPVDVDDIVLAEAARLRKAGLVTVDATGIAPVRIDGDRGMLGQVVRNLADNAARHATSTVALSLAEVDRQLVLTVDDDGSGVADADRERIFARFVRLDEARARESGGSGLGLAIVRSLVAAHSGAVAVSGSPLGGARFTVTLPVDAAVPAGASAPGPAPAPAPVG
ncbi:HAMP domain-containing histidine kinase [Frondihabitans sp. VKM Ac-2883]|nr:HAMP domain-containing sensor histidine kinase [Frondihabitans sp. VKM Ac-2883]MBF4575646.1 HAMP domain-containing histidine kinase [Frondihabitans sp. VKM Ac-2883]